MDAVADDVIAARAQDWPFRIVRVEESTMVVRTPERAITIPFKGTLKWPQLHVEATPAVGKVLTIDAAIGDPRAAHVRFSGDGVAGDDVSAALRALVPKAPLHVAGDVAVKGTIARIGEQTTFDAEVAASSAEPAAPAASVAQLAGTNVTVEEGVFHIAGSVGGLTPSLKIAAKDVSLSESSAGAKASGVSADVLFDNLLPTVTLCMTPQSSPNVARGCRPTMPAWMMWNGRPTTIRRSIDTPLTIGMRTWTNP